MRDDLVPQKSGHKGCVDLNMGAYLVLALQGQEDSQSFPDILLVLQRCSVLSSLLASW